MSERIKAPKFDITARDPVHLRQQIHAQQEPIVALWGAIGIDKESIQRNRNQQEWEIRRCYLQLRYPDRQILPFQSKKDRLNSAVERLDAIFAGMSEAREIMEATRRNKKKHTNTSENGNRLYGQEQSFDHNGGVIFAPNSEDHQ